MPIVVCDESGRIVIPKKMRDELGTEFHISETKGSITLVPIHAKKGLMKRIVLEKA